jgi:enterochelin esterase-like enzyme
MLLRKNNMKTRFCFIALVLVTGILAGCGSLSPAPTAAPPTPTLTPAPTPACSQPGTTVQDKVPIGDENRSLSFSMYLPPCYAAESAAAYPVLYWTAIGGQYVLDTADELIRQGELPPFLVVMLETDGTDGFGADGRIIRYVVPYVDAHYRTLPDPGHRSITGISHGAAIAARAALQPPNLFGRLAVISGGIADGEQQKFTTWLQETPPKQRPLILIDVGDQDGIIMLTRYLMDVLDKQNVPYTFTHAAGGHAQTYWSAHMSEYLKWLMSGKGAGG